jgi:glycosyltransferase involved in cell wall biosynthesis
VTLDSAGDGEEIALCRAEAESLGIADRIRFHGHLPRQEVERLYASSDLFVFPSFREPSGRVISEAMRWGLPVLAADCGGPGHVVNASCGFKVAAENPEQLASDIANVIQRVAERPYHLVPMRAAARKKVAREGLWPAKAKTMLSAYQDVLAAKAGEAVA